MRERLATSGGTRHGALRGHPNRAVARWISFTSVTRSPAGIVRMRGRCAGAGVNPSVHFVLPRSQASSNVVPHPCHSADRVGAVI